MSVLELRLPQLVDEPQVRAAQVELARDDFTFALGLPADPRTWADGEYAAWVALVADHARGERVPAGWVRSTLLLALRDGELAGRVSVRHELNAALREDGGHVGYGVRPGHRRHGVAAALLAHALGLLSAEGTTDALVTCAWDNHGSRAVVEGAGGVLVGVRELDGTDEVQRRYRVPTGAPPSPPPGAA